MDQESAQHHGCNAVAGDTENQKRDHSAADRCIVSGFCSDDTFRLTFAESLGVLGHVFGSYVSKHTGCGSADAGKNADTGTDDCCTQCAGKPADKFLHGEAKAFDLGDRDGLNALGVHRLCRFEDIRYGEDTDQGTELVKACHQLGAAECETRRTIDGSHTDHREYETKHTSQQSFDHLARRKDRNHGQCEEADTKVLNGSELQCHVCKHRCKEGQDEERKQGSQEGEHDTNTKCSHRLALLSHGITVKCSCDRRCRTGHVQEDRGDQTTGDTADVDGNQGIHTKTCFHTESQGKHQCNRHGSGKAGNRAEHDTDCYACHHEEEGLRRANCYQSCSELC